jgi:Flp pilus assembly protein TadD
MPRILMALLMVGLVAGSAVAQSRPREAVNRNNFGSELVKQGRLAEALAEFRRAVEVDPSFAAAQANLAFTLTRLERLEEAVSEYEKAIALDPQNPTLHNNLGVIRNKQGRYEDAIAAFEEALRVAPDDATARKNLDTARANQKEMQGREGRIAEARRVAEARPHDPRAAYDLARALAFYRQDDEALSWLAKAVALRHPDRAAWREDPAFALLKENRRFVDLVEGR